MDCFAVDNETIDTSVVDINMTDKNVPGNSAAGHNAEEETVAQSPEPLCFACNEPGTKRCAGCENARYCSSECQKSDWKMHKLLCASFAQLVPRPGPNYFRGILFPKDEHLSRFVWNEYRNANIWYTVESNNHTPGTNMSGHLHLDRYRLLKRMLNYTIGIYYRDSFVQLPMTPALTRWLGPEIGHRWRGPFLAHGYEKGEVDEYGEESEDSKPRDLDTSDLAPLFDFFKFVGKYPGVAYESDWDESEEDAAAIASAWFSN